MNSEGAQRSRNRTRNLIALLALFALLFLITPFKLGLWPNRMEIQSVFYWTITDGYTGIQMDAPFPIGMTFSPNPFWWMSWLEVVFALVIIGYYRGLISHKTTYRIGLASLGPGLLTVTMGFLLSIVNPSMFAAGIPVPIPAVLGLYLVRSRPLDEGKMWIEEAQER